MKRGRDSFGSSYEAFWDYFDPDRNSTSPHRLYQADKQGPIGRVDSYQMQAVVDEEAWFTSVPKAPQKTKKIIFADPLFHLRDKAPEEFELWDELTQKQAVYIWKGERLSLVSQTPTPNRLAFSEELENLVPDLEDNIKKSLAEQGLEAGDYIIIDIYKYYAFLNSILPDIGLKKRIPDFHNLLIRKEENLNKPRNLNELNNRNSEVAKKVTDFSKFELKDNLYINSPQNVEDVSRKITENADLKNLSLSATWEIMESWLARDDLRKIETLELIFGEEILNKKNIVFPDIKVNTLNIAVPNETCIIDLRNISTCHKIKLDSENSDLCHVILPTQLTELEIEPKDFKFINADLPENLKKLRITPFENFEGNVIINLHQFLLEDLKIEQVSGDIRVSDIPDTVHCIDVSGRHVDLNMSADQSKLQTLSLRFEEKLEINQNEFTRLKKLRLVHDSLSNETIKIGGVKITKELDLSLFPNLEEITISGLQEINNIKNLPKSLKSIRISNCPNLETLNLEGLSQLEFLKVFFLKNLDSIENIPESLKNINISKNESLGNIDLSDVKRAHHLGLSCLDLEASKFPQIVHHLDVISHSEFGDICDFSGIQECYSLTVNEASGKSNNRHLNINLPKKIGDFKFDGKNKIKLKGLKDSGIINIDIPNSVSASSKEPLPITLEKLVFKNLLVEDKTPEFEKFPELRVSNPNTLTEVFEFNQRVLNRHNQDHPTALLDFDADVQPDGNTGGPTPKYDYSGRPIKVTSYGADNEVDMNHYRATILDQIQVDDDDTITFKRSYPSLNKIEIDAFKFDENETAAFLKKKVDDSKGDLQAFFMEVELGPDIRVPLTSASGLRDGDIKNIYCNETLIWHKTETQQIFFELPEGSEDKVIKIAYLHNRIPNYLAKEPISNLEHIVLKNQALLPESLRKRLEEVITANAQLHFLQDQKTTLLQKLQQLKKYCTDFTKKKTLSKDNTASLDTIIDNLINKCGSCRHRAECFMLIAHYLQVPALMVRNQSHRYIELPFLINNEITFHAFDLGGGEMLDITPAEAKTNPFEQAKKIEKNTDEPGILKPNEKVFLIPLVLSSVFDCFDSKAPRTPLIMLHPGVDPVTVNAAILIEQCGKLTSDSSHLYIHSPADFTRYMRPVKFENGTREVIEGPLKKLIQEGGVLAINWNNFNPTQRASYKSLLEEKPTFRGLDVTSKLKVISLLSKDSPEACESFSTRTTPYRLDSTYLRQHSRHVKPSNLIPIEVDLFGLPNWRERLLGEVQREGKNIFLTEGALIQAIKQKRPLQINNAPNDLELNALLKRVETELRLFYNGKFLEVSDDFHVIYREKENPLTAKNVKVISELSAEMKPGIILNSNNIHECIKRLVIDNKMNTANSNVAGWFYNCQNFYISDYISKGEWQELISEASLYGNLPFTFTLLPGGEIEGLEGAKCPHRINDQSPLIFSNDPDFYCLQQEVSAEPQKKPLIIDVTSKTTYQNLVANLLEVENAKGNVDYTFETQKIFEQFLNGRHVILNGEINAILYQQLIPFLKPEIALTHLNGERMVAKGKLTLVMPDSAKQRLNPGEYAEKTYSLEDYKRTLSLGALDKINKLEMLFKLANQLPHLGLGQPTLPTLSYAHLSRLLDVINKGDERLHLSNPIKGLLHYDYPKNSQNYAVLNVMAKYLFAPDNQLNKSRSQKLKTLNIKSLEDVRKNPWAILNACNVSVIREILGDISQNPIQIINGQAHLSDAQISHLFEYVIKEQLEPARSKNPQKSFEQIQALLQDKKARAIFLKGVPGSGKTHTIRQLQESLPEGHYHKGTQYIVDWLNAKPAEKQPIILHLDEANMEEPSTWDIFKGLFRNESSIYYQGKEYQLSDQHKVFFTGNDETLPGRHYHRFFQQYAETIHCAMPVDEWIHQKFILPVLKALNIQDDQISQHLLWAFHHVKDYHPHIVTSLRDIDSLVQRFKFIYQPEKNLRTLTFKACLLEFSCAIPDLKNRTKFIEALRSKIKPEAEKDKNELDDDVTSIGDILIPESKKYIVEALEQDLIAGKRRGVLFEGGSGIGKSSLMKALLEKHQFSKNSLDPKKKYYEITVDSSNAVPETLIRAALAGSKVILDELNLDPKIEGLLNDLLEGVLPRDAQYAEMMKQISQSDNPKIESGFQVFASQNGGTMAGRKALSSAERNRFHMTYFDPYSRQDLISILAYVKIPNPELMVDQFFYEQKQSPGYVNTRTLFEWMKKYIKQNLEEISSNDGTESSAETDSDNDPELSSGSQSPYVSKF